MSLRIYLTGRVAIEIDGRVVASERELRGRQGRLVFAYLVCERTRPVSREELATIVWPKESAPSWESALSSLTSRLGGMLSAPPFDSEGARLTRGPGYYQLHLPVDVWVDLEAGVSAIDRAEAALRAGAPERMLGPATVAATIARRPFLSGMSGFWEESQRRRLERMLVRSLDCLAEMRIAYGQSRPRRGGLPQPATPSRRRARHRAGAGDRGAVREAAELRPWRLCALQKGPVYSKNTRLVASLRARRSRAERRSAPIDEKRLKALLQRFKDDGLSLDDVAAELRELPYEDLGFAKVDHHRAIRKGFPEVIFGQGKSPEQIASIAEALMSRCDSVLVTRASAEAFAAVRKAVPDARFDETARTIAVDRRTERDTHAGVLVVCAGTADLPVACEAVVTAEMLDCEVERVFDVGVAGIHRLLDQLPALQSARVIVAVAGMEGALPSVIGGLVRAPVIAVPTSVGYGASFGGLAAMLAMMNSCAPGIGVVNIDNGFGAGYLAAIINKTQLGVA